MSSRDVRIVCPRPKTRQNHTSTLVYVIFAYCEGTAHQNFGPPGNTVNQHYYRQLFLVVWGTVRRKRSEWWRNYDRLLHSNKPAHSTSSEQQFLVAINMNVALPPSLLAALGLLRLLLLSENEIAANSASCPAWFWNSGTLADHPARGYYCQFYGYFQQWQKSWTLYIKSEGDKDQQHREVRVRYVTASVHSDTILYDLLGIQLLIYYHRRVSAEIPNTLFEDTDNMKHSDLTVHELISRQVDAVERIPILLHTQKNIG
jgi:hypothetical protein